MFGRSNARTSLHFLRPRRRRSAPRNRDDDKKERKIAEFCRPGALSQGPCHLCGLARDCVFWLDGAGDRRSRGSSFSNARADTRRGCGTTQRLGLPLSMRCYFFSPLTKLRMDGSRSAPSGNSASSGPHHPHKDRLRGLGTTAAAAFTRNGDGGHRRPRRCDDGPGLAGNSVGVAGMWHLLRARITVVGSCCTAQDRLE